MGYYKRLKNLVRNHTIFDNLEPKEKQWFVWWLKRNMFVYAEFKERTLEYKSAGRPRMSARKILHDMRWDTQFMESQPSPFKISDHSSAYMARLVLLEHEELAGFFIIKGSKGCASPPTTPYRESNAR